MIHVIDIRGGKTAIGSQTVRGEIRIGSGSPEFDVQIAAMYREVDERIYKLFGGDLDAERAPMSGGATNECAPVVHDTWT